MTEQENLQIVQQGYQHFERGDLQAMLSNLKSARN